MCILDTIMHTINPQAQCHYHMPGRMLVGYVPLNNASISTDVWPFGGKCGMYGAATTCGCASAALPPSPSQTRCRPSSASRVCARTTCDNRVVNSARQVRTLLVDATRGRTYAGRQRCVEVRRVATGAPVDLVDRRVATVLVVGPTACRHAPWPSLPSRPCDAPHVEDGLRRQSCGTT